ncbi:DUF2975 domain-containing protein [Sphingomonas sp. MMS24-J45]|uniref:DUF2975 domain-containing protein n=1 Tax=Sphingomonas sp. MMS24-J45 TaxID=3238806 RepID=UPI00384C2C5D
MDDRVLRLTAGALRLFRVANLATMAAFALAILLSFAFAAPLEARLIAKYGSGLAVETVVLAMRLLLAAGLPAGAALHLIFTRLLALVATVRDGDPFTLVNAQRLETIGWAMLALQLLDLGLGGFSLWFAALHVEFVTWSPSFGGWIAALMLFVLARVFRRGAEMRDDLAMTV